MAIERDKLDLQAEKSFRSSVDACAILLLVSVLLRVLTVENIERQISIRTVTDTRINHLNLIFYPSQHK